MKDDVPVTTHIEYARFLVRFLSKHESLNMARVNVHVNDKGMYKIDINMQSNNSEIASISYEGIV